MDLTKNFNEDFCNIYGYDLLEKLDEFFLYAMERTTGVSRQIDEWYCSSSVEKHDALNYSYHFDIYREVEDSDNEEICVTFYTGINVGCELVDYSLEGKSLATGSKTIQVVKGIEVDWSYYPDADGVRRKNIELVVMKHQDKILEMKAKQYYDNYVTGGGTVSTDNYYREYFDKLHSINIHWNYIYEDEEVFINYQ